MTRSNRTFFLFLIYSKEVFDEVKTLAHTRTYYLVFKNLNSCKQIIQ
jgi:hypothetical protein